MAYKDDLVNTGVFINQANVLSNHDIRSALTTTQIARLATSTPPVLTTNNISALTTTQVSDLNAALLSVVDIAAAIKAQS